MHSWKRAGRILLLGFLIFSGQAIFGVTLTDLHRRAKLTPSEFAGYFKDFHFVFHAEIQNPDVFLATESGDCDDYATLAASILREKGYTPRLIAIRMPGVVHVVCYIQETHSYLDYNERHARACTVKSGNSIAEIAQKVSKSFGLSWGSASEFTFDGQAKRLVATVVEKQPRWLASGKDAIGATRTASLIP